MNNKPNTEPRTVHNDSETEPERGELLRLLLLARDGDEDAFAGLVLAYRPMLDAAVTQYRSELLPQDFEELQQEALVAFHRAVGKYDFLYGNVSFGLYAKICVNKAIISALRTIWRSHRRSDFLPLDDDIAPGNPDADDPSAGIIEQENAAELRRIIRENLSEYENTVWWKYYSGMSIAGIAQSVGKTPKSVGNALSRIRRKLRGLLGKHS